MGGVRRKRTKPDPKRVGVDAKVLKIKKRPRKKIDVALSVLNAAARKKLPASAFAIPPDRYPIHDIEHAKAALSRVAQHGTPEEKQKVARAVARRYGIGPAAKGKKTDLSRSDHDSSTHPDLPNKPGKTNWVERQGGLPSFIKRVARHIMADGKLPESHAIAAAVQQCRDGRFGAKGLAAYAEFRAKAAAARGSH